MDPIGFEYGRCEKKPITGAIREINLLLLDKKIVHRLSIKTEKEAYTFGPDPSKETAMDRMTKEVIKFDDPSVRPMGFFGSWKNVGLTSLGVI